MRFRKFVIFALLVFLADVSIAQPLWKTAERPALIPLPQQLKWEKGTFDLKACKFIVLKHKSLMEEAVILKKMLANLGLNLKISMNPVKGSSFILLDTGKVEKVTFPEESYQIQVNAKKITLLGFNRKGLFYSFQTLRQLAGKAQSIPACTIVDWPAFSWRGYMADVGRNFQPVALLKQQIEVMATYKLNVFHLHLTEDIAWRLESKLYPQLHAPENMLRNKGNYYTEAEMKELIAFCKARHIQLIPEIDMPGHSAAFKRAMKTEMQSDTGLRIVKNIITEFCQTYDLPYLHIGADEVRITNANFLPEVTATLEKLNKKMIGWEPGGNFTEGTIRQLWMEDATKVSRNKNIRYIDSRHLYLNHMDPLESVVTIFNRQIANLDQGNENALGGIICNWPDRRIAKAADALIQNPVYPAMLAFAERSWRGGGKPGWIANIGRPESEDAIRFAVFENRLLRHKELYFSGLPFPYVRQSGMKWKFFGPFVNAGDLSASFMPEQQGLDKDQLPAAFEAVGGTIILRHWWAPEVKGELENPQENTTWYAYTKLWADQEGSKEFWIGFNNLSRSYASDSPEKGSWDHRKSGIQVNGVPIAPPDWAQPGLKGDLEIPLTDEGYEFRKPTKVRLKKGWNEVLIKLPIGSFKGADWKNPQKWMFTMVPY